MKNIMIVFVAALSMMAVTGCKKKGGSDAMAKMAEFKDKICACKDAACAQKVSEDMNKWTQDMAKDMKDYKPTEEETKKGAEIGEAMGKCMQKLAGAPNMGDMAGSAAGSAAAGAAAAGSAEGAAPAGGAGADLPKECQDYKASIEKLQSCDKMPQAARDAMKSAFDQASTGWANLPAEAKAGLATACKAGADAVMQSGKAACGW